ncbi:hypothetical protein [Sinorhizobium fredii]|uniref:hypothetical protein n=1 Tax=Rhizobium fredii TaxID=380 RepID=UPI00131A1134|nr:hypothetical protein [Sinorhizobium fredii]
MLQEGKVHASLECYIAQVAILQYLHRKQKDVGVALGHRNQESGRKRMRTIVDCSGCCVPSTHSRCIPACPDETTQPVEIERSSCLAPAELTTFEPPYVECPVALENRKSFGAFGVSGPLQSTLPPQHVQALLVLLAPP